MNTKQPTIKLVTRRIVEQGMNNQSGRCNPNCMPVKCAPNCKPNK